MVIYLDVFQIKTTERLDLLATTYRSMPPDPLALTCFAC